MRQNAAVRAVLVLWAATLTLIMQVWVGGGTIYRPELAPKVTMVHDALLTNTPPADGWYSIGGNGTNIRVVSVFLAEGVHRLTGLTVPNAYFVLDTVALFAALLLLVVYLRRIAPSPALVVIGMLFVGSVLPLTYQLFYFHPWDRLSLFMWLLLLVLLRDGRDVIFALLLPLGMAIKYDLLFIPGLYFLARLSRGDLVRVSLRTAGLFAITFGSYMLLRVLRPGGFEVTAIGRQVLTNLQHIRANGVAYPPLLGFALPLVLAGIGFRRSDQFARASALFGLSLFVPFALQSNLVEFRAHVPVLLLLLPMSLMGVQQLLEAAAGSLGAPRVAGEAG